MFKNGPQMTAKTTLKRRPRIIDPAIAPTAEEWGLRIALDKITPATGVQLASAAALEETLEQMAKSRCNHCSGWGHGASSLDCPTAVKLVFLSKGMTDKGRSYLDMGTSKLRRSYRGG